ncbi:hypothetical protein A8926_2659 [Saccharopolyspora spinosa]|uniref:Uncharacterized protein n=1 Tax=Saccharopolyspora spinosa TaxID=60894 RepID=A0A2N3XWE7_SACSN|nr:hypothetical protein A8926_2659 [Saccharopolyspora spinosa]
MPRPCRMSFAVRSGACTSKATSRSRPAAETARSDWARLAVPAVKSTNTSDESRWRSTSGCSVKPSCIEIDQLKTCIGLIDLGCPLAGSAGHGVVHGNRRGRWRRGNPGANTCGVENEIRDRFGVRHDRQVAGVEFYGRRPHARSEEPLKIGRRGPVILRHRVPGRFVPPRRDARLRREQRIGYGALHGVEAKRATSGHVASEIAQERFHAQLFEVAEFDDSGIRRRLREPRREGGVVLADVWCTSGDVNQTGDIRESPASEMTVPPQE